MENNVDQPLFTLRGLAKDDVSFVFNSLLKSYRDSPTVAGVPNTIYYASHHAVVEALLQSPHAKVLVACNSDDSSQIFGYLIGRDLGDVRVLDWLYVKHPFRGYGIARSLEQAFLASCANPQAPVHFTHRVKQTDRLMKSRAYVYNPYLLMGIK